MKIRKLFKLTFFLFIISTTCLVNSSFSADITRNHMNALKNPDGWDVKLWGGPDVTQIVPSDSPDGGTMLQYTFPVGLADGSEPGNMFFVSPSTLSEAYIQFYHKYSSNYVYHPIGNKLVYFYSTGDPVQSNGCFTENYGDLKFEVYGGSRDVTQYYTNTGRPKTGVWYKYNIHTKVNTSPGSHDGILQVWINDVLKINRSDVMWFASGTTVTGWRQIDLAPAYGGGGGSNPVLSYSYYDDITISATPINEDSKLSVNPNSPSNLEIK